MKARWVACGALAMVLAMVFASPTPRAAASDASRSIVRIKSGLDGWSTIHSVCALLGCQVTRSLDTLPGETVPSSLFLVENLPEITPLQMDTLGVEAVEPDLPVALTQEDSWGSDQATAGVLDQLWDRALMDYYGTTAWQSYLQQPAADIVRVTETHCALGATGAATVAIIDTGVDPDHPALAAFLTAGFDFTRDLDGGNEKADVDQATAGVLDGVYLVNRATAAALDQATAGVLDDPGYSHFGHGTMVAGVVHLVAPTASIMPLKAFGADGVGYTSDIIRAVHYAALRGAKVLNMSFSRPTPSAELQRALDEATASGLIAVASAGNDGQAMLKYPAAHPNVMGVASTSNTDSRSPFSNYGAQLVWVAAPGEGIITTYPWGSFAAAWGTSFSTPFVSGAAALLAGMEASATQDQVASAVSHAVPLAEDLGHGRLDLYLSVQAGRELWPDAAASQVPDTCYAFALDWSEVAFEESPAPSPEPSPSPSPSPEPSPSPSPEPSPAPSPTPEPSPSPSPSPEPSPSPSPSPEPSPSPSPSPSPEPSPSPSPSPEPSPSPSPEPSPSP